MISQGKSTFIGVQKLLFSRESSTLKSWQFPMVVLTTPEGVVIFIVADEISIPAVKY